VIDHRGATTYVELAGRIDRMCGVFRRLGVQREQRVLLCLLDTVDFPTVFLGAIKAGVVPVPLNTLLVEDDYRWILRESGAAAVFVSGELSPHWTAIAGNSPEIGFVSSGDRPWTRLDVLLAETAP
jgi:benzoate-CoA ligase